MTAGRGQAPRHPHAWAPHLFPSPFSLCRATAEPLAPRSRVDSSSRPHSSPTPSVERPSFPTAPRPPPLATGSPLSLADSGRAPPSSATARGAPPRAAGLHHPRWRPPEPPPCRRTPPPDAVGTASPSTRRSGAPLSSPPCPTPSP
jgi:hypothetical protein